MRVRDLQEFLSTFTARDKSGTKQGNAISDAVIFVEVNGFLEEIKKMEVYENNQPIFGLNKIIILIVLFLKQNRIEV